jgi:hypothetical protein
MVSKRSRSKLGVLCKKPDHNFTSNLLIRIVIINQIQIRGLYKLLGDYFYVRVNWKYVFTIFKDRRSTIKNHLIGNLSLQFNHTRKLAIAIQIDMKFVIAIRSDIENLPFNFGIWLNNNDIYLIS